MQYFPSQPIWHSVPLYFLCSAKRWPQKHFEDCPTRWQSHLNSGQRHPMYTPEQTSQYRIMQHTGQAGKKLMKDYMHQQHTVLSWNICPSSLCPRICELKWPNKLNVLKPTRTAESSNDSILIMKYVIQTKCTWWQSSGLSATDSLCITAGSRKNIRKS